VGKEAPGSDFWNDDFDVFHKVEEAGLFDLVEVGFAELGVFFDEEVGGVLVEDFGVFCSGEWFADIQREPRCGPERGSRAREEVIIVLG